MLSDSVIAIHHIEKRIKQLEAEKRKYENQIKYELVNSIQDQIQFLKWIKETLRV